MRSVLNLGRADRILLKGGVQNHPNNARMANTILAFITTNLARAQNPPRYSSM
jgi:hypothetical protein